MFCVYKAFCHVACQLCLTNIRTYKSSQMAHPIVTKHGTPPKRVYVYITGWEHPKWWGLPWPQVGTALNLPHMNSNDIGTGH